MRQDTADFHPDMDRISVGSSTSGTHHELYYYTEHGKPDHDPFTDVPYEQVADVLSFVSLPDRNHFARTCRQQRRLRAGIEATVTMLSEPAGHGLGGLVYHSNIGASPYWLDEVEALRQSRSLQLSRLVGLRSLNIGPLGNNDFLRLLSSGSGRDDGEHLLPNLEELSMVDSLKVNDVGILALGQRTEGVNGKRRDNLRFLDITFCEHITYGATLELRKLLPSPLLVRRQPRWLDGHFETPFSGRHPIEVHTYYPDGSFSFDRDEQAAGYVARLFKRSDDSNRRSEHHLADKLQYIDFRANGWPNWTRFAYRPGVSLRRVPDEIIKDQTTREESILRSVLVAQNRKGFRPPTSFPALEHIDKVPLGESRLFSKEGEMLARDVEDDDNQVIMVSRMKVVPLSEQEMIPPIELTDRIDAFVSEMNSTDIPDNGEEVVHAVLGGHGLEE
mmetsp:Transcript_25644/g.56144  ORF Transcript_25644/g.56144 Transcript_25644/m.56144 type:complete len:446 (+) Transcript_25644:189-1526(+)